MTGAQIAEWTKSVMLVSAGIIVGLLWATHTLDAEAHQRDAQMVERFNALAEDYNLSMSLDETGRITLHSTLKPFPQLFVGQ